MGIAQDRVGIKSITEAAKKNFNKLSDGSILEKARGAFEQLQDGINGVQAKVKDVLGNLPEVKNFNIDTKSLGMFENILCGKLPNLNIRLPELKLDFDLEFPTFNYTVCGTTKSMNPLDTALTLVDKLKDPKAFIANIKSDLTSKLMDTELANLVSNLGLGQLADCLGDRSKSDLYNGKYGDWGGSLEDKWNLQNSLSKNGCAQNIMQALGVPNFIKKSALTNILDTIAGTSPDLATKIFGSQLPDQLETRGHYAPKSNYGNSYNYSTYGSYRTSSGTTIAAQRPIIFQASKDIFYKNTTGNNVGKMDFIADSFAPTESLEESKQLVDFIVTGVSPKVDPDDPKSENKYKPNTIPGLRTEIDESYAADFNIPSKDVYTKLESATEEEVKNVNVEKTLIALNTLDPSWTQKTYETKDNRIMTEVSNKYLLNDKPSLNLTGDVTTKINPLHEVLIVNSVQEDYIDQIEDLIA